MTNRCKRIVRALLLFTLRRKGCRVSFRGGVRFVRRLYTYESSMKPMFRKRLSKNSEHKLLSPTAEYGSNRVCYFKKSTEGRKLFFLL